MTPLSHLNAAIYVPYRHKVSAVVAVAPAGLDLNGPLKPYSKAKHSDNKRNTSPPRMGYGANSAAPGFAAQVLVEAGLTGSDPFAAKRCARAYDTHRAPLTNLRLVA